MTALTISQQRLSNQQVPATKFNSVKELVRWMGAIQAQDYAMAKYAIGVRTKNSTNQMVENAINNADIIRTNVLRPTWHFVAAKEVRWMLELTAPNLNKSLSSNNKRLELDDKTFTKSNSIIEKLLRDGKYLTRNEIMAALDKKGIKTNDLRASHIMFRAETDLVVCNGNRRDKQFTYTLFNERVPLSKKISKEEAIARLALRYVASHGPATLQDFVWWSGLSVTDARRGWETIKSKLVSEKLKDQVFWTTQDSTFEKPRSNQLFFLPSYDEFLISYQSREISLDARHTFHTFTKNGIFNPVIVHNGRIIGIWKPEYKKDILLKEKFFIQPTEKQKQLCSKAAKAFRNFWT